MKRAPGYSEVNKEELGGIQRNTWPTLLDKEIAEHFGSRKEALAEHKSGIQNFNRSDIRILDIGAGPGFISIILAELGYNVTAADFAESMLMEAKMNAGELAGNISFKQEDAMNLSFENESFDVIVSRNLTWNLQDPEKAYSEWLRVLKRGGLMLVFDANWYAFLVDENKKAEYENDRNNVAEQGYDDYNIGENFDVMDKIAMTLPLTGRKRPEWDEVVLRKLGASRVTSKEDIGSVVYSEKEKVNYASTPMFMIKAEK
ncbi:Methyltransferase domain-containing protein [Butyrivibrio sp. INlla16]|nr:Methyltransferase domain-containing protein [Butyrivibrio sp. INlla16]